MAESQGMTEFVDRGLHGTFDEFVLALATELGQRDDRPSTLDVRMTEDQRESELRIRELDVRDRDDAIAIRGSGDPIEHRRSIPFRTETERSARMGHRTRYSTHVIENTLR